MSGGSLWQSQVLCPFYKRDDTKNIFCEGVVENSTLVTRFQYKAGRNQQMRIFCCQNYKCCEIYRMLMEAKYEEEG